MKKKNNKKRFCDVCEKKSLDRTHDAVIFNLRKLNHSEKSSKLKPHSRFPKTIFETEILSAELNLTIIKAQSLKTPEMFYLTKVVSGIFLKSFFSMFPK